MLYYILEHVHMHSGTRQYTRETKINFVKYCCWSGIYNKASIELPDNLRNTPELNLTLKPMQNVQFSSPGPNFRSFAIVLGGFLPFRSTLCQD